MAGQAWKYSGQLDERYKKYEMDSCTFLYYISMLFPCGLHESVWRWTTVNEPYLHVPWILESGAWKHMDEESRRR